jgi:hypothetical protein
VKSLFLMFVLAASIVLPIQASQEGWLSVRTAYKDFDLFYQPLSIQVQAPDVRQVTSVINYISKTGRLESLISKTRYNCKDQTKLDLATSQHQQHWGDGELIAKSPPEPQWRNVTSGSVGASLMVIVCTDTQAISPQLER